MHLTPARLAFLLVLLTWTRGVEAQTTLAIDGGWGDAGVPSIADAGDASMPLAFTAIDAGTKTMDAAAEVAPIERGRSSEQPAAHIHISGLRRTRASTISELLPRVPPAVYTDLELRELQRRLDNLGVFDEVIVRRVEDGVEIALREKWTLIPTFDLQRGKTFEDTFLMVGATEYNFLGTASSLSAILYHEERGWNGEIAFGQHGYHPGRGAVMSKLEWVNSNYRFEDMEQTEWYVRSIGGSLGWSMPLLAGRYFTYEFAAGYHYEDVDQVQGSNQPATGHELLAEIGLFWDHYHWTDLSPRGWMLVLMTAGGGLLAADVAEERLLVAGELAFAQGIARHLTLMGRWVGRVSSRGNANFSALLGGLEGVRGLDDALYRNWAQTYLNLELRQTIPIVDRLAAQVVLFSDAAAYRQLDAYGRDAGKNGALSAGFGARMVPTFLAQVLFRVDVARLLLPRREWFVSWGLSQYF